MMEIGGREVVYSHHRETGTDLVSDNVPAVATSTSVKSESDIATAAASVTANPTVMVIQ